MLSESDAMAMWVGGFLFLVCFAVGAAVPVAVSAIRRRKREKGG